jgi:PST family polysaccharide transporter
MTEIDYRGWRGARAAIGVALLASSNVVRLVAPLTVLPILARLITPSDYGLFAIAMPLVTLGVTIGSGGLGAALVRAPKAHVDSTAFWAAGAVGLLFVALLSITGPVVGAIFGMPNLWLVVVALSPAVILSNLSVVPRAVLQRSGLAWALAATEASSTVVAAITALGSALLGWGVWSLIAQQLVLRAVGCIGYWVAARFSPAPVFDWTALSEFLRFGIPVVGTALVDSGSQSINNFLIGTLLDTEQLGNYALSWQLIQLPSTIFLGPIFVIFFPAVARLADDRRQLKTLYLSALRLMTAVAAPASFGLATVSDLAVPILLGPRWEAAGKLLATLAPIGIALPVLTLSDALLMGVGRSRKVFVLSLLNACLTAIGILVGTRFGLTAAGIGVTASTIATAMLILHASSHEVRLRLRILFVALWPPLAAGVIMSASVLWLRAALIPYGHSMVALGACILVGAVVYTATLGLISWRQFVADLYALNAVRLAVPQLEENL